MKKKAALAAGYLSYATFLAVFIYFILFSGNLLVANTIDQGSSLDQPVAIALNVLLIFLFGLQHSGMARGKFKLWWNKHFPKALQRSAYVFITSLTLVGLMAVWRPLPQPVWTVQADWLRAIVWLMFGLGWLLVFVAAQLINSRHLFGLQQVKAFSRGKKAQPPHFQTPFLYRHVRHPMMLGFLIAFWSVPTMSLGHLLFSIGLTAYILIGLRFEERDLAANLGKVYQRYSKKVPMLLPVPGKSVDSKDLQPDINLSASSGQD